MDKNGSHARSDKTKKNCSMTKKIRAGKDLRSLSNENDFFGNLILSPVWLPRNGGKEGKIERTGKTESWLFPELVGCESG